MFLPSVDTRIDWFRVLTQLKGAGHSLYSVATFTEINRSTLNGYKAGSEPKYHDGDRLLRFWARVMKKDIEEAPRVNPYSYKA